MGKIKELTNVNITESKPNKGNYFSADPQNHSNNKKSIL